MDRWIDGHLNYVFVVSSIRFDSIRVDSLVYYNNNNNNEKNSQHDQYSLKIDDSTTTTTKRTTKRERNFKSNKIVKRKVVTRSLIRIEFRRSKIEKFLKKEGGIEYILLYGCLILKFFLYNRQIK